MRKLKFYVLENLVRIYHERLDEKYWEDITHIFPYGKVWNGECGRFKELSQEWSVDQKKNRKRNLTVIILLHNFRTEVIVLNRNYFNEEYDDYVNVRNYDRITQYYEEIVVIMKK